HRLIASGEQGKGDVGAGRRRFTAFVQGLEGYPADEDRHQRLRVKLQTVGVHGKVNPPGIPEASVRPDILVIRRSDEDREGHPRAVLVKIIGDHLCHLDTTEVDRRTDIERAEIRTVQLEAAPRYIHGDGRRHFQAGERPLRLLGSADVDPDVGAAHQRPETGDATPGYPGPYHPELGVLDQVGRNLLLQFDGRNHVGDVLGDGDIFDQADLDILVLDLGLSSLQPVAGLEGDRDGRPLLQVGLDYQGATDDGGHDRYQPDQLQGEALPGLGHCLGDIVHSRFMLYFTHARFSLS